MDLNWLMEVKSLARRTLTPEEMDRLRADEDYRIAYKVWTVGGQEKGLMLLRKALIGLGLVNAWSS